MGLSNFFEINLPYGLKRDSDNNWFAFNREYMPIGWNETLNQGNVHEDGCYPEFSIHTKYYSLTDKKILSIIKDEKRIHRNEDGTIKFVHLYTEQTNPISSKLYWNQYFEIIIALSKLTVKRKSKW